MKKQGQSILEFSLIFIIVAVLILGLLSLWKWSKDNILARTGAFESQRVGAGKKGSAGLPEVPFKAGSPGKPNYLMR